MQIRNSNNFIPLCVNQAGVAENDELAQLEKRGLKLLGMDSIIFFFLYFHSKSYYSCIYLSR
jgi:hypothetical protein